MICVKTFLHQQLSFPRHYDEIIYSKVAPLRRNSLVLEKLYFESLGLLLVIPRGPIHILNLFPFRTQVMDQKKTQTSFSFLLFYSCYHILYFYNALRVPSFISTFLQSYYFTWNQIFKYILVSIVAF